MYIARFAHFFGKFSQTENLFAKHEIFKQIDQNLSFLAQNQAT